MSNEPTQVQDPEVVTEDALTATARRMGLTATASDANMIDRVLEAPAESEDDLDEIVASILAEEGEDEDGGLEEVFGRNEGDAEGGKWVPVSEMGEAGDLVRRLQIKGKMEEDGVTPAITMLKIAKVPNKQYNRLIDLLQRKWQARHRDPLPLEKVREALPAIYGRSVLKGLRNVFLRKADAKPLTDSFEVRSAMLRKYDPELLDAVEKYGRELKNFQDKPAAASRAEGVVPNS